MSSRSAISSTTAACRAMDPDDPAKYDYALFGMGVYEDGPLPEDA